MSLNPQLVSELIRQRMGWPDDSHAARVVNMIPQALKEFGRQVAANPELRPLLVSNKATASLSIGAGGAVDLAAAYPANYFLLEFLDQGQLYLAPTVSISSVDAALDTITIAANLPAFASLDRVQFTGGSLPGGVTAATNYYLTSYDPATGVFGLSSTSNGLTPVPISSSGSGTMTKMDATGQPMQRLTNPMQASLDRYLDSVFSYFYVQGDALFVLPSSTTGSVKCALPTYPATLSALPDSAETERLFLDIMMATLAPAAEAA